MPLNKKILPKGSKESAENTGPQPQGKPDEPVQEGAVGGSTVSSDPPSTSGGGVFDSLKRHLSQRKRISQRLKKARDITVNLLDAALPGLSTQEIHQKASATETRKSLKRAFQENPALTQVPLLEIGKVFGLRDVQLGLVKGSGGKDYIKIAAPYLDGYTDLPRYDPSAHGANPIKTDGSGSGILFPTPRDIHSWINGARTPCPAVVPLIVIMISNVTDTRGKAIVTACGNSASLPEGPITLSNGKELLVSSECTFKIDGLATEEVQLLESFIERIMAPASPRLWVPYHALALENNGPEGTLLKLYNYPEGESAQFVHIQELAALSCECIPAFRGANESLRMLLEKSEPTTPITKGAQLQIAHDLGTSLGFLALPSHILSSPWIRYCVKQLANEVGLYHVSSAPTSSTQMARCSRDIASCKTDPSETMSHALANADTTFLPLGNFAEVTLLGVGKVIEQALLSLNYAQEICKGSNIKKEITDNHLRLEIATISTSRSDLLMDLLRVQTSFADCIFSTKKKTEIECAVYLDLTKPGLLNESGKESLLEIVRTLPTIYGNLYIICETLLTILPLGLEGQNPFTFLNVSCAREASDNNEGVTQIVQVSWDTQFLGKGYVPRVTQDFQIEGIKLLDRQMTMDLKVLRVPRSEAQELAQEIMRKLKVEAEKLPEPIKGPEQVKGEHAQRDFFKKFSKKRDPAMSSDGKEKKEEEKEKKSVKCKIKSFFGKPENNKEKTPKKKKIGFFKSVKLFFATLGASTILAAVIYISLSYIPKLRDLPEAVQAVGSVLTAILLGGIGFSCVKHICELPQVKKKLKFCPIPTPNILESGIPTACVSMLDSTLERIDRC